jgi:3-phenylpropionate/cinnamic acid dioxygenase small subunit
MEHEGIRHALAAYCQLLDDGRFDEWVDMFTDDVAFAVMGRTFRGRDAVRGFVEPTQGPDARGRHVLSEPLIDVDPAGGRATASTDYCFVSRDLAVLSAGRYHDVLVLGADGRWRIEAREIVFVGDQPRGIAPAPASEEGPR